MKTKKQKKEEAQKAKATQPTAQQQQQFTTSLSSYKDRAPAAAAAARSHSERTTRNGRGKVAPESRPPLLTLLTSLLPQVVQRTAATLAPASLQSRPTHRQPRLGKSRRKLITLPKLHIRAGPGHRLHQRQKLPLTIIHSNNSEQIVGMLLPPLLLLHVAANLNPNQRHPLNPHLYHQLPPRTMTLHHPPHLKHGLVS